MLTEFRTGISNLVEGSIVPARISRIGALVKGEGQGRYYEATSRGTVFSVYLGAWTSTIAAGNIVNATAAPSSQFAVWNPAGSGKILSLLKFGVWPISGTAPIPPVSHSAMLTAPSIATTVVNPITCNNAGMAAACVARACTSAAGATLTGSSALTIIRCADLYITAGAAANLTGWKVVEYIDGDIQIPPGTGWVPTWVAAGTTFLGGYSLTWEEIPVQPGYNY
jgi:hypothetical protein